MQIDDGSGGCHELAIREEGSISLIRVDVDRVDPKIGKVVIKTVVNPHKDLTNRANPLGSVR